MKALHSVVTNRDQRHRSQSLELERPLWNSYRTVIEPSVKCHCSWSPKDSSSVYTDSNARTGRAAINHRPVFGSEENVILSQRERSHGSSRQEAPVESRFGDHRFERRFRNGHVRDTLLCVNKYAATIPSVNLSSELSATLFDCAARGK